jgi:hypothetical protein
VYQLQALSWTPVIPDAKVGEEIGYRARYSQSDHLAHCRRRRRECGRRVTQGGLRSRRGNTVAGAIGGIVSTLILQALIPALRGIAYGPIIGQVVVAAASGTVLTVIVGAVKARQR